MGGVNLIAWTRTTTDFPPVVC